MDQVDQQRPDNQSRIDKQELGNQDYNSFPEDLMATYTAVVERCADTGLFVGYVPGFPGAHTQADTLDELNNNLKEVIELLLEDGEPKLESEFVGIQAVMVG
jgi:predicted RNase H-like HicB family nuclease